MHHVIVGAGPAGVVAAETLRRVDSRSAVTLICGEAGPPYSRMAIPYVISGKIDEPGTHLRRTPDHFQTLGVALRHDRVTAIDPAAKSLSLADGKSLAYDRLLIATGSSPARPPISGLDQPGVYSCWTLDDMRKICAAVKPGTRLVLLGAGFVACIIIPSLLERGAVVTVVCGSSGRMVRSMMDETSGGMIMRWCRKRGVRVITSGRPQSIAADLTVTLESGETAEADIVVVATGVTTNTGFLAGSGVMVNQGIVVDQYLQSSVSDIYAAGDVAEGMNFCTGKPEVHAIQPTAVEHGRIAAMNMTGRQVPFHGSLSMNTLDTMGLVSCSFGQWMGRDGGHQARAVDQDGFKYIRLEFFEDLLVGANTVGLTQEIGICRGLIETRVRLGAWVDKLVKDPGRLAEAYVACTHGVN